LDSYKKSISRHFALMRAALSHYRQRSHSDLQQLLAWYKIRDTLVGDNFVRQEVKRALELAAVCEHPDAVWLTKLFAGRNVNTEEEMMRVFRDCDGDPRAVGFAAFISIDNAQQRRAADLGDAYAQAVMALRMRGEECFRWAEKSAAQGECEGFCPLGRCCEYGEGCEMDEEMAKEIYLITAALRSVYAVIGLGDLLDKNDPQQFNWFGKAAVGGMSSVFLGEMAQQVRNFKYGHASRFCNWTSAQRTYRQREAGSL
jgi:TPR repeat protein